ncbi:hypothetical protein Hanom_Chr14g01258211 [Helianthus anomalus]
MFSSMIKLTVTPFSLTALTFWHGDGDSDSQLSSGSSFLKPLSRSLSVLRVRFNANPILLNPCLTRFLALILLLPSRLSSKKLIIWKRSRFCATTH